MKTKLLQLISVFLMVSLIFSSCKKSVNSLPNETTNNFDDLEIPEGFTWSTLNKSVIKVMITDMQGNPTTTLNGFPLDVTDLQGNRLVRSSIINGETEFYLELNKSIKEVKLVAPSIEMSQTITLGEETYSLKVANVSFKNSYIDSDQDGVYDVFDDFPNDGNLAYTMTYPLPYQELDLKSGSNLKSTQGGFTIWYYQIYEDLWPSKGDYDFNDLSLKIKMVVNTNASNKWASGRFDVYVWTNGAAIDLGCGIDFYKYNGTSAGKQIHEYMQDGVISLVEGSYNPAFTKIDPVTENAIVVFNKVDDVKAIDYWNTGVGLSHNPMESFVSFEWSSSNPQNMRAYTYLFYTNDRGHEIRTINLPPTQGINMNLLGTVADNSPTTWNWNPGTKFKVPADNPFFVTRDLHPWGIEIEWDGNLSVPAEYVSILDAFPQFKDWAESGGVNNTKWYKKPSSNPALVFNVGELVD